MAQAIPGDAVFPDTRPRKRRSRPKGPGPATLAVAIVLLLSVGVLAWWYRFGEVSRVPVAAPAVPAELPAAPLTPVSPPLVPGVRHPVELIRAEPLPPLHEADRFVRAALDELLGAPSVRSGLVTDGFLQRFVVTLDGLARDHAPPSMWPVQRTPGRFTVENRGEGIAVIGPDNWERYAGFVRMMEQVDVTRAVLLYRHLYPLFQQAYEGVGFPGAHFNDRLVDTIDHLLAAPEPDVPVAVRLVEVHGPMKLSAPWLHYEFVDPEFEALSAGQKLMVRIGPRNEQRVKAVLERARAALVGVPGERHDAGRVN